MANGNGFNVFDYVDELKEAGLPEKQADIFARAFHEMASASAATKQDLEVSTLALKHDIELVKKDIKELDVKIENIRRDIKKDMLIASGSIVFLILTGLVTLAKLGLLTPV